LGFGGFEELAIAYRSKKMRKTGAKKIAEC